MCNALQSGFPPQHTLPGRWRYGARSGPCCTLGASCAVACAPVPDSCAPQRGSSRNSAAGYPEIRWLSRAAYAAVSRSDCAATLSSKEYCVWITAHELQCSRVASSRQGWLARPARSLPRAKGCFGSSPVRYRQCTRCVPPACYLCIRLATVKIPPPLAGSPSHCLRCLTATPSLA